MSDEMDTFIGRWEVTGTENMDNMLKAADMEEAKREMYKDMKFIMQISRPSDNRWQYEVFAPQGVLVKSYNFAVGEEFDSTTLDGRPILSKVEVKDNKLVEYHKDKTDPTLDGEIVREVIDNQLIVTASVRNITSITRHKRL